MQFRHVKGVALAVSVLLSAGVQAIPTNSPPIVEAGPNETIYLGDVARLHGAATDPDGDPIVDWDWDVISTPLGSAYSLAGADTPEPIFTTDT